MEKIVFIKPKPINNSITDYKKLVVWRNAYQLVLDFYPIIERLPECESKNISDQIRRAVTSLPLNIAEGASSGFRKVFYNHMTYAYSSAKELDVLLMLLRDLKYITLDEYVNLDCKLDKFRTQTYKFMLVLKKDLERDGTSNWNKE